MRVYHMVEYSTHTYKRKYMNTHIHSQSSPGSSVQQRHLSPHTHALTIMCKETSYCKVSPYRNVLLQSVALLSKLTSFAGSTAQ